MTLSLWRYSHLLLALFSSLFLIVASVTGVVLALEPISNATQNYHVVDLEDVSLARTLTQLKKNNEEVLSIKVTADSYVIASVITLDGTSQDVYIHPETGTSLGLVIERAPIYRWTTNLHRSLFLKSIGRIFVGIVSLLLCFIAFTGILLLIQRQGGFLKLYGKIKERDFNQRYHIILGRWLLFPILIIAVTGVYLSAEKFDLTPSFSIEHDWSKEPSIELSSGELIDIPFFQELKMSQIDQLSFPFSEDQLDYFEITLHDCDLLVDQYSGEIISEVSHPFAHVLSSWSMTLHTGSGSIIWSVILLISSASILFFIFSGIAMYLKRRKKAVKTIALANKEDAEIVILVGSEGGSTFAFAKAISNQLSEQGKKVYLSSLNEYSIYEKATQFIIFTATYGDGDAPTNARHFLQKLTVIEQPNPIRFAVLGFGSRDYDHFCKYAVEVDTALQERAGFTPMLPLDKINSNDAQEIEKWLEKYKRQTGITLKNADFKEPTYSTFKVLECSVLNLDDTFLLCIQPHKKLKYKSGDILYILPPDETKPRAYSIARIDNYIILSIKKHDRGLCSTYLNELKIGDQIEAYIKQNERFHLPKKERSVIMISNGTGIAPFLGMINEKKSKKRELHLYWGGRSTGSFDLYQPYLKQTSLSSLRLAYSREMDKRYIQHKIWDQRVEIAILLSNGSPIMICGSLAMMNDVLATIEKITIEQLGKPLSVFEQRGQVLTDCY
ncbi:PepSY domain-containing protein [Nonlabens sp. Asnod3-A02]|uniref:PepSY domain-containing protein n=1 Tax=Nonlabens sp. Asnod3-A02 TaxID=3160579 RepID=UPI0038693F0D